ncbi:MAG: hypothetical protein HY039_02415 [Nitrospirae bacterium]|nr:hypothetical protein [Nitrospirota bacterium]
MPLLRSRSSALGTGLLSAVLASSLLLPVETGGAEGDLSRAFFDMSLRELDGEPAPDFALADLSEKTYSPKDFSGKVLLLNFMNTW